MGTPKEPTPVKYFVGFLSAEPDLIGAVEEDLSALFGSVDARSRLVPWSASKYYEKEMGERLLRRYISFARLQSPAALADLKLAANTIEQRYPRVNSTGRRVNLDPGYLESGKLVLASTKNANQRVYLGSGIYAEVALQFYHGEFHAAPHTYGDYTWPESIGFFVAMRTTYLAQLRQLRNNEDRR